MAVRGYGQLLQLMAVKNTHVGDLCTCSKNSGSASLRPGYLDDKESILTWVHVLFLSILLVTPDKERSYASGSETAPTLVKTTRYGMINYPYKFPTHRDEQFNLLNATVQITAVSPGPMKNNGRPMFSGKSGKG
ncbi:MAG TPA: hypothetical protein VJT72_21885 [Pseudonocardiaceae bacterium]|nr:hypothetical protein [Pseudonocardiaceae bacterium]